MGLKGVNEDQWGQPQNSQILKHDTLSSMLCHAESAKIRFVMCVSTLLLHDPLPFPSQKR